MKNIRPHQFEIGDLVRVKSWSELISKYQRDKDGDIVISGSYFLQSMRMFCDHVFEISAHSTCPTWYDIEYELHGVTDGRDFLGDQYHGQIEGYIFTDQMLDLYTDDTFQLRPEDEKLQLLGLNTILGL